MSEDQNGEYSLFWLINIASSSKQLINKNTTIRFIEYGQKQIKFADCDHKEACLIQMSEVRC